MPHRVDFTSYKVLFFSFKNLNDVKIQIGITVPINCRIYQYLNHNMNNSLNQNVKVMEETLAGSNSDAVKTTLRCLRYFKMTFLLFQVIGKRVIIPLSLSHMQY